jgi:hypothetical protein
MKIDPLAIPEQTPEQTPGRRSRRPRDDDEPKGDAKPKRNWKEPEGFFQGARVKRR